MVLETLVRVFSDAGIQIFVGIFDHVNKIHIHILNPAHSTHFVRSGHSIRQRENRLRRAVCESRWFTTSEAFYGRIEWRWGESNSRVENDPQTNLQDVGHSVRRLADLSVMRRECTRSHYAGLSFFKLLAGVS